MTTTVTVQAKELVFAMRTGDFDLDFPESPKSTRNERQSN